MMKIMSIYDLYQTEAKPYFIASPDMVVSSVLLSFLEFKDAFAFGQTMASIPALISKTSE